LTDPAHGLQLPKSARNLNPLLRGMANLPWFVCL